jgi:hypothetical protein
MDVLKAIRELQTEKQRLDEVIARLEALTLGRVGVRTIPEETVTRKRRGRKSMGQEERAVVSKRMRDYWASRRKSGQSRAASAGEQL